ncbi:MAG TPA: MFS transporter, partial [Clostridia bacterium]|nr:MFS transporter [Clostridia bacterium]
NMFMFSKFINIPTLAIGVAVAGICYGAAFSVFPATISDLYGAKHFGVNYGLIFTSWGVGGVIGPMMAAFIFDATKTYNASYFVASILLVISALIAFTFKNAKKPANVLQK